MSHGIKFGSYHTWDDLGLSMTEKAPNVGAAEIYQNFIDIPGGTFLDGSEYPGGYPTYKKRMQSFEFAKKESGLSWPQTVSNIMNKLHGKSMDIILDDDPAWHYHGRLNVQAPSVEKGLTRLVINATSQPYKEYNRSLADVWQWDETDFDNDTFLNDNGLTNVEIDTESSRTSIFLPYSPCRPTITVTATITGFYGNATSGVISLSQSGNDIARLNVTEAGTYTVTASVLPNGFTPQLLFSYLAGSFTVDYTPRSL